MGDLSDGLHLVYQVEKHLQQCNDCTEEYKAYKQTIDFVKDNKDIFAEVFVEIDQGNLKKAEIRKLGFSKIPLRSGKHTRKLQSFIRIAAVAASIIFIITILFAINNHNNHNDCNELKPPQRVSSMPSIKIENLTDNYFIPAGQEISTKAGQLIIPEILSFDKDYNITIGLCGFGEPLLNTELAFKVLCLLEDDKRMQIILVTNGANLGGNILKNSFFKRLNKLIVSVTGWNKQSYEKINGLSYKVISNNLLLVRKHFPSIAGLHRVSIPTIISNKRKVQLFW